MPSLWFYLDASFILFKMCPNQSCLDRKTMLLKARINIQNGTFEEWLTFFQSYSEVTDIDGLTELSAADDIRLREKELGVITAFID
ncbi:MAG: hypothetical protein EBX05_06395 [Rhodobacteraceae bacterium]|nr:hypothetical protein [Paracoccaceae bacterium]